MTTNIVRHYASRVDEIIDARNNVCVQSDLYDTLSQLFNCAIVPCPENMELLDELNVHVVQSRP